MVQIDLKAIKAGIHEFDWVLSAENLGLDPALFGDVELGVRLDYHPPRALVTIQVDCIAHLVCDRTLVDFDQPVQGEYTILYSGPEMFEGVEADNEDIQLLTPDIEEIDLTDAVRDTLLLSIPQRRIAPGAEDKDIPLQFGVPDNEEAEVDPRWEALKVLRDKSEGGE